ncbi:MAG: GNAT family N-acetyltransferase [Planctomycetes bacterium]|nr:GNAT family N-acetyltransferase [Planctomycetota bacterium]
MNEPPRCDTESADAVGRDPAAASVAGELRTTARAGDLSARLLRGAAEIADVDAFHRRHQWHAESHAELLRASLLAGRAAEPVRLAVERDGVPVLLVVAQVVEALVPWRVGYGTLGSSRARVLEILRGGILGDESQENIDLACDRLRSAMRELRVDAIAVRHVAEGSSAHLSFARRPNWLCRDRLAVVTQNWQMTVPADYAAFLAAQPRREREDNRRYERRIRQQFGDRVEVERVQRVDDVERVAAAVESIARKTYQRGLGAGFRDTAEERARWRTGVEGGFLVVHLLRFGGEPVAFATGYEVGGTLWLEHLGYDPAFRRLRPGFFLLLRLIEEAAAGGAVRTIDFGIGDADYKRRLCDARRVEVSVWVFAPTLRGLWLNAVRASSHSLYRLGHAVLGRLGLLQWFKRRWRRALQSPDEAEGR